jgi:hypothetical protein
MEKKINKPQKGAAKKWAGILKEIGQKSPPKELIDKINEGEKKKVAISPVAKELELELE